jgi:hypothetical protein
MKPFISKPLQAERKLLVQVSDSHSCEKSLLKNETAAVMTRDINSNLFPFFSFCFQTRR